ncbi:ABC transporter ATP-binding protein [Nocardioides maradonensis]
MSPMTDQVLLEVKGLVVDYATGTSPVHAVDKVDLTIRCGEALGLAGESGSGKSTLAMAVARLLRDPAQVVAGEVWYHEPIPGGGAKPPVNVLTLDRRSLQRFRWRQVAVVLQSAMNALNPVLSIRTQLTDVLRTHEPQLSRADRNRRAAELLEIVGMNPDRLSAYPHQLSGGMRQRTMIAMALALRPQLMIMDEPTTALDVVTQRQIITELTQLREQFGFAMAFITHDLSLLLETADTIAVMYGGRLVEYASAADVYAQPAHPYTEGLLNSFPPLSGPRRELVGIPGSPPSLRALPPGCSFQPRCPRASDTCGVVRPELLSVGGPRLVACHHDLVRGATTEEVHA